MALDALEVGDDDVLLDAFEPEVPGADEALDDFEMVATGGPLIDAPEAMLDAVAEFDAASPREY